MTARTSNKTLKPQNFEYITARERTPDMSAELQTKYAAKV